LSTYKKKLKLVSLS